MYFFNDYPNTFLYILISYKKFMFGIKITYKITFFDIIFYNFKEKHIFERQAYIFLNH